MRERVFSLFMAFAMCLSLIPGTAWAVGDDAPDTLGQTAEKQETSATDKAVAKTVLDAKTDEAENSASVIRGEGNTILYGNQEYRIEDGQIYCNGAALSFGEGTPYKIALADNTVYAIVGEKEQWVVLDDSLAGEVSLLGNSDNEREIFLFTQTALGVNTAATCGILANIYAESSFRPTAYVIDTNGLPSYGICQWNGGRYTALQNYCSQNGYDYTTLSGQLQYLKYELTGSERSAFNKIISVSNTAQGAYDAGYNWARYFERCASRYYTARAERARDVYWSEYSASQATLLANDAQTLVNYLNNKVGAGYKSGACQMFVWESIRDCFGRSNTKQACCATKAWQNYGVSSSRDNIPLGAAVYFGGSKVTDSVCGQEAGHVGLYVGDGYIVHDWGAKIIKTTIDYVLGCGYSYRGWGWQADYPLNDNRVAYGSEMASGYERTLPDGDYMIASALDPSYYLDISGAAVPASNSNNVALWHLDGEIAPCDVWTVKYADGFYRISQMGASMSLDVDGIKTEDKTNIQVWENNETSAQKWAICQADSGDGYAVAAKCSGYLLTVANKTVAANANVCQHAKDGSSSQSWLFIPYKPTQEIQNGNYVLISGLGDDVELDVSGDSGDIPNGTNVQIWSDTAPSQYNSFTIQALTSGYYKLIHTASNKALEVMGGSLKLTENIQVFDDNGAECQQWAITPNGNGYYILRSRRSGFTLDVENGNQNKAAGKIDGVNVRQWIYNGTAAQTWKFVRAEYTVSYNANGGTGTPGQQTKYYKGALTLSDSRPSRPGYDFMGWATSNGGNVRYQPGEIYTNDSDVTLYAVWSGPHGSEMASGYERALPDGDYMIASALDPSYYLDISGAVVPASNSDNVALWPLEGEIAPHDVWTVKYADGFYRISQMGASMSLDVSGVKVEDKANIQVWENNDASAQKWAICKADSNDGYAVAAKCSGYLLTVEDKTAAINANVCQHIKDGSSSQSWLFIPYKPTQEIQDGNYVLISGMSDGIELDVSGDTGDIPNGTNVQIWSDTALSQYNSFTVQALANGYYKLIHTASKKALEVKDGSLKLIENIQVSDDNGSKYQQWAITRNENGYMLRSQHSGFTLDVENGNQNSAAGNINGVNVRQWLYNGTTAQTWKFVRAEYTVSYNANNGTGAPSQQTKYYKGALTLSDSRPARPGYDFMGWATSNGGNVRYQPGETYTDDNDVTLYAVWKEVPVERTLSSIEIANKPNKTVYNIGEAWNGVGLSVKAIYSDNSSEVVSDGFNVSGFDSSSAGRKTVTVTYGGKETSFTVDVQTPATSAPQIVVENKRVSKGGTIDIPVRIKNNPGIAGAVLTVSYDKAAMTLTNVIKGTLFEKGNYDANPSNGVIQWYYTENVTGDDGALFTLQFEVNANAQDGNYSISVGLHDGIPANLSNADSDVVNAQFISGTLEVTSTMSSIRGDVTGDGVVAINDVVKLARAVAGNLTLTDAEIAMADVTSDGVIAINDVVKLARYVAGNLVSLQSAEDASLSGGESAVIEVATVGGGPGETVRVPVSITSNPGIAGAQLDILFDSGLTLKNIIQGDVLSAGTFNPDISNGRIQWYYDQANVTNTGVLFTLEFEISAEAQNGDAYAVTVNVKDGITANLSDYDFNPVNAEFKPGKVQIAGTADNVAINRVSRNENTVTANVVCGDSNASIFCAAYSNSGKMIAVRSAQITGESSYQFQFDGQQFAYAKVFILDSNFCPLCAGKKS